MKIKIETEKEYKIVDKLIEKYMLSDNLNILEDVLLDWLLDATHMWEMLHYSIACRQWTRETRKGITK